MSNFDLFTQKSRHALTISMEEAQRLDHNFIGTAHLLLALAKSSDPVVVAVFRRLNLDPLLLKQQVEFLQPPGDRYILGEIGLTPRCKRVIELAVQEARRLKSPTIDQIHLFIALFIEGGGIAAGILSKLVLDVSTVREAVDQVLSKQSSELPPSE